MRNNQIFRGPWIFGTILPWRLSIGIVVAMTGICCNRSDEDTTDTETANQAIVAADQATAEASMLVSVLAGLDPNQLPQDLASASAALADDMDPPDCASAQVTGTEVRWTFQNCTGPFGRALLEGTLTATFRVGPRGTTVDVTSSDLTINDIAVDIDATLVLRDSSDGQSIDVDGTVQAETDRFGRMTQTGAFTVTWQQDTSCITVNGTWNTSFGTKTWRTNADALTSCPDSCLTGSLTFEGSSHTYDMAFSSNGEVSWSLSTGRSGTIQTACGRAR